MPHESPGSGGDLSSNREDLGLSTPSSPASGLPGSVLVQRVDKILARTYHLQTADRQDVIAEALLECVRVREAIRKNMDGFFLVVARRRACDFWRRRSREDALAANAAPSNPGKDETQVMLLEEAAACFFAARTPLEGHRAQCAVREILEGATFTEACRAAMIPRGSQGRYRLLLRQCFWDVLRLDRKRNTSSPTSK